MLKIAFSSLYSHPLPEGHRFPMEKYSMLPEQLLYEGTITRENLFEPTPLQDALILNTHDEDYFSRLTRQELSKSEIRAIGFPLSSQLVEREICIAGGSIQAALMANLYGIGMNIAGGTHHAFRARGEGFCLLNDLAITANYLLNEGIAKKIFIVDLDVHQGNGTASIFSGSEQVFTFSMHGEKNYPHRKENSHLDISLANGTSDKEYLYLLEYHLDSILERIKPDFILYQCGVDVLSSDQLGRLALTMEGVKSRDKMVLSKAKRSAIPIMCCMGGGYSKQIRVIVEAHAQVFRLAQELYF